MKNTIYLFLSIFLLVLGSCKDDSQKNIKELDKVDQISSKTFQVLKHPLVFEELGLKIAYFKSEEIRPNVFNLSIGLESETELEKYTKDHFFLVHAFDYNSEQIINMDTRKVELNGNIAVFKREVTSDIYDFREIRFGLVDKINEKRCFIRTIEEASIKK